MRSRLKKGSNQFKQKKQTSVRGMIGASLVIGVTGIAALHYLFLGIATAVIAADHWKDETFRMSVYAPTKVVSPLAGKVYAEEKLTPTPAPTSVPEVVENTGEQDKVEAYVKTIFGKDARVAIAVSHNECNPANAKYPQCVLHSGVEYSVGLFQINLYNKTQWIHAGRVPGGTMEEKIEWLKNPYNNALYAYWVFKTSGWTPWTAYTSGNYLKSL